MMDTVKPLKLRVLHVIVQPVLVLDDGSELHPVATVKPVQVRLSELAGMAQEIADMVHGMQTNTASASDAEG
jgi:hypothetical protein